MNISSAESGSQLWCKPKPGQDPQGIITFKFIPEINGMLTFYALDLDEHLAIIHDWMNKSYTVKFWQLSGSELAIRKIYEGILNNPHAHSFIGKIGREPVCLIDMYHIIGDELSDHIEDATYDDCGMHLLMCPPRQMQKGWSLAVLKTWQQFFFSRALNNRLFAEPDVENYAANHLALKAGFSFVKKIKLSYKTANLYCIWRSDVNKGQHKNIP